MSCLDRLIFVAGFARGGTSWLRTCVAAHPDVQPLPAELAALRDPARAVVRGAVEAELASAIREHALTAPRLVDRPAPNALHVARTAGLLPEARFVYVLRDPRDVLVSHQRGTPPSADGRAATADGCMEGLRRSYDGSAVGDCPPNLLHVRYEDLHQDFHATLARVFAHLGLRSDEDLLESIHASCSFFGMTGRTTEDRASPLRKGVVGDWAGLLSAEDQAWFRRQPSWSGLLDRHGYGWAPLTYRAVLEAIRAAEPASLDLDAMLEARLDPSRPNLVLLHDIDLLRTRRARDGVVAIARIEAELGLAGVFHFLPLDDVRYRPLAPQEVIDVIRRVQEASPRAAIGLHFNATERFFPPKAPPAGEDHPDLPKAIAYLHEQVDAYERLGIRFRFATAHGYGRGAVQPNNTSPRFRGELAGRGIRLYDGDVREAMTAVALGRGSCEWGVRDVGGSLSVWDAPNNGPIDRVETYRSLPPGSLMTFLIHPGNYDVLAPMPIGARYQVRGRRDLGRFGPRPSPPAPTAPEVGGVRGMLRALRRLASPR